LYNESRIVTELPRAGSGIERIDSLRFLAECRKRRLNQALSVFSLSLVFTLRAKLSGAVYCYRSCLVFACNGRAGGVRTLLEPARAVLASL